MAQRIIFITLRLLLGATFCFSAIVKLYPIEPFEYTLVEQGISNWSLAPFASRLIIAFELALGLNLLFGVKLYKLTLKATMALLVFFTLYLFIQLYKEGNVDNCGCFGTFLKMTPFESIVKNLVLLLMAILLYYQKLKIFSLDKTWLFVTIAVFSLVIPPILNPPDWYFQVQGTVDYKTGEIDFSKIPDRFSDGEIHKLNQGKVIAAFVSPTCPHCKLACMKLSIIKRKNPEFKIYAIFYGNEKYLDSFVSETKLSIPYLFYNHLNFMKIVDGSVPAVLFIDNGKLISRKDQLGLDGKEVENFLISDTN